MVNHPIFLIKNCMSPFFSTNLSRFVRRIRVKLTRVRISKFNRVQVRLIARNSPTENRFPFSESEASRSSCTGRLRSIDRGSLGWFVDGLSINVDIRPMRGAWRMACLTTGFGIAAGSPRRLPLIVAIALLLGE